MQQNCQTIGSISREILKNFVKKERKDGSLFWDLSQDIEWQHHIVMEAYRERMLCPEAYVAVFKVLIEIYIAENEEQAEEFLYDIDSYSDPSDLTNWLNSSNENLRYLDVALKEQQSDEAKELLAKAHKLFLQEIGLNLIKAIKHHIHNNKMYASSVN